MFKATLDDALVGLHLWFEQGEVAYGHLGATNELGHATMAAYALYEHARDYFRARVRWLDLGAGAGSATDVDDGLVRFKRGWATGTRPVYLCTRVLDAPAYAALAAAHPPTQFFPAYRAGE
jgi:lipid II:glycine glycyltransferase (peptidoglycan interpeptide bridge formation enzyme)